MGQGDRGFTLQMISCWTSSVMTFRLLRRLGRVDGERVQQVLDAVAGAQLHNNNTTESGRRRDETRRLCGH